MHEGARPAVDKNSLADESGPIGSAGIDRREAIRRTTLLLGVAISAPTLSGLLGGCSAKDAPFVPSTLTASQNELVVALSEHIIPTTDTPGAKAARVNEFIDVMLSEWYDDDEVQQFLTGLTEFTERHQSENNAAFLDVPIEKQHEFLTKLDLEAEAAREYGQELPFFARMKELTISGYYTSEIGMTQELQWLAAPGRFDGCAPLDEIGRTWA